jgi:hypothetical protein
MALAYLDQLEDKGGTVLLDRTPGLALSLSGVWCEPEHGDVLHRDAQRLASFAWRAHGLAQGMCQPPDDGHLAEWSYNLAGVVRFLGDEGVIEGGQTRHRRLLGYHIDLFHGGFATCGAIAEGTDVALAEGWRGDGLATHWIAYVALPDGHTVLGLQRCQTGDQRTYLVEAKGLHYNLPNDLFNGFSRRLVVEGDEVVLESPPQGEYILELGSTWANVEDRLGVVGIYGDDQLVIHRADRRRGGKYASLYVDELCWGCVVGTQSVDPGAVVLDVGWAVLSSVDAGRTAVFAEHCAAIDVEGTEMRAVRVQGLDSISYAVVVNWRDVEQSGPAEHLLGENTQAIDVVTKEALDANAKFVVPAGQVRVFALS